MTANFNPRLSRLDVVLVLGTLVAVLPLALFSLDRVSPGANNTAWAVRIAFFAALAVLFARGRFFGPPEPGQRIVPGARGLLGLVTIGVGATLAALGTLVLIAMSSDVRSAKDLVWLAIPLAAFALGCACVLLGARIRAEQRSRPRAGELD